MSGSVIVKRNGEEHTAAAKTYGNRRFLKKVKDCKYLLILLAPCVLYYLIFQYAPMFGLVISFKDYNLFKGVWHSDWVGLKYYKLFVSNPDFFKLLRNTFLLGFFKFLFGFPAPVIFALLLNEVKHMVFKRFVQTVSYLPHFISNVVVASMVMMFLAPHGLANKLIGAFGFHELNFLVMPELFRSIYVSSEIWQHIGWETIIYLAALTAIDPQLYEAAEIDGAGRWNKLLHVTLPGILPAIFIIGILNIGHVLDIGFEKVFLLYNPVTYETADIISTYVYRTGLVQGNYSYATAIGLFTGIISLTFIYTTNYFARKSDQQSLW